MELTQRAVHIIREDGKTLPTLAQREADYICYVLTHCKGNRTKAAQILGIDRVSL
ncbi:MAG: hypothetical protein OQL08_01250 [Gammaproteobacteria bacterium]|nr:hypothetical protein [Gammaproteobacteria bacterium]